MNKSATTSGLQPDTLHENADVTPTDSIEETTAFRPRFGPDGLLPCVATDADTGDILMLAWVNAQALNRTLETGFAHYWSRSRQELWKKGETSGALQRIAEIRTDCDQDAIQYRVATGQRQATCHTGRESCFYRTLTLANGKIRLAIDDRTD